MRSRRLEPPRSPLNIRRGLDARTRDDMLHEETILGELRPTIVKPLPPHTRRTLDNETLSFHSQPRRLPDLQCLALIEGQPDIAFFFFVGNQLVAVVYRTSKPVTENAKRAIDLRGVLAEESSEVFRLGLRFAKEAQHFLANDLAEPTARIGDGKQ